MRKKKVFLLVLFALVFASPFHAHALELVPCKDNCNLCDIISGMKRIFDYLGLIIVAAATLFIAIAGFLYIFSSGSKNLMELAKKAFITCLAGFLLYHFSWLVVDAILKATGYNKVTNWWQFDCEGSADVAGSESKSAGKESEKKTESKCDEKNKKLDSIKIQCAEKDFKLEGDGVGFYIVLDTLSEDEKGKTKQLKAVAKYTCQKSDGSSETSEEDVTAQAEWKASDETQVKVAKGLVQAVSKSLGSSSESVPYVEARFQEKNSNQAKVYINACPNTTAEAETKNEFSFSENSLIIPKAKAQTWTCPGCKTQNEPGSATCKSCGRVTTCHHVEGTNPNGPFFFIFARSNSKLGLNILECDNQGWSRKSLDELDALEDNITDIAKGISYLPDKSKIGVYWTNEILDLGETDTDCPEGKLNSYGYIYNSSAFGGAFAYKSGDFAVYCKDRLASDSRVFAHEQIGHILGDLSDEYPDQKTNVDNHYFTYNCTKDANCTKWKSKSVFNECIQGCLGEKEYFYRSSENSIMNQYDEANGFNLVSLEIIQYFMDHYPNGPEDLKEQYQLYPWEFPTL